jgi:hypothetical protein
MKLGMVKVGIQIFVLAVGTMTAAAIAIDHQKLELELIAGIDGQTDGNPHPALLRIVGKLTGLDGSILPVKNARLIGVAYGSLVDSRVLVRLNQLNISLPNGERRIYPVDGWLLGKDGLPGIPGFAVDPRGVILNHSAVFMDAFGLGKIMKFIRNQATFDELNHSVLEEFQDQSEALRSRCLETTIEDLCSSSRIDVITSSVQYSPSGSGLDRSPKEWEKYMKEKIVKMKPAIRVYGGQKVTAVFCTPLPIEDLHNFLADENLGDKIHGDSVFRSTRHLRHTSERSVKTK